MEPKRSESFGERTVDDIERDGATVRRDAGELGGALDRDARVAGHDVETGARDVGRGAEGAADRVGRSIGDVGAAARSSIDAVGDAARETAAGAGVGAAMGSGLEGGELRTMSTDNTAVGRTGDIGNTGPIDLAVRGMRVVDASGVELGKVDDIKMGDPGAATTRGEEYDDGDLLDDIGRAVFGGSALPDQIRHNLIRVGYMRIDGKGWFDTDYFVAANQIARVEGDTVHLSVAKDALPTT